MRLALAATLVLAIFVVPAQGATIPVSAAAEKGALPALGSLPRFPDDSPLYAASFSAALSSTTVTGTLDMYLQPGQVYPMSLSAGDKITAALSGDPGTDFDLYLFWPSYTGPDDFDIAAASVELDYPEDLEFSVAWSGTYYLYVDAYWGTGDYAMTFDIVPADGARVTDRLWGATRYETAIEASRHRFVPGSSRDVVLASGDSFADALAASSLAGALGCPLLLTQPDDLPTSVRQEITRLGVVDAHIVGGEAAVLSAVDDELDGMGITVFRYQGGNRFQTAEQIAIAVGQLSAFDPPDTVFVARGDIFADALVGSPFAYARGIPVLLTNSESLSSEVKRAIRRLGVENVIILGSYSAITGGVEDQLSALSGVTLVDRVGGHDRYDTARRIAQYAIEHYWATTSFIGVASGADYPDALSGGAITGAIGGVLILTEPGQLTPEARSLLYEHRTLGVVDEACVFGGRAAVSSDAYESIQDLFR